MKLAYLMLVMAAMFSAFAERQPISRYQSIIDRQMFGEVPPGFDPEKMPSEVSRSEQKQLSQEQEKLQSAIHFSAINLTPNGEVAVGFTDNSDPKAPVCYYLKVGEQRGPWKVLEADPQAARMRISRGDIEVELELGGNSAKNACATSKSAAFSAPKSSASATAAGGLLGNANTLRARRSARAQLLREQNDELQRRREEERAEREAEREERRNELQEIKEQLRLAAEARDAAKAAEESEKAKAEKQDASDSEQSNGE